MENTQLFDAHGRPASYTYRLSLSFVHVDQDLSDIPEKLGLTARRLWKKGEEYIRPNGSRSGFPRRKSACVFSLSEENQTELSVGLFSAVSLLKPHRVFLHEIVDSGVEAYLSVGWFGQDGNFGEWFDWQLIRDIADLKLSLNLDIYSPDANDTNIESTDAQRLRS